MMQTPGWLWHVIERARREVNSDPAHYAAHARNLGLENVALRIEAGRTALANEEGR